MYHFKDILVVFENYFFWIEEGFPLYFFILGLIGGLLHCTFMCGAFSLNQVLLNTHTLDIRRMTSWNRLRQSLLFGYHGGRTTTYIFLTVFIYGFSHIVRHTFWGKIVMLLGMGLIIVFYCIQICKIFFPWRNAWRFIKMPVVNFQWKPRYQTGYLYGVALGFLPCGFLYALIGQSVLQENIFFAVLAIFSASVGMMIVLVGSTFLGVGLIHFFPKITKIVTVAFLLLNIVLLGGHIGKVVLSFEVPAMAHGVPAMEPKDREPKDKSFTPHSMH